MAFLHFITISIKSLISAGREETCATVQQLKRQSFELAHVRTVKLMTPCTMQQCYRRPSL